MACVNPDGTLTPSARKILEALTSASRPEAIAVATGVPLFRVRSSLRELEAAGLVRTGPEGYTLTNALQHAPVASG